MTGKTDVRVRAHTTYSVTEFTQGDYASGSRELASNISLDSANTVAKALFAQASDQNALVLLTAHEQVVDARHSPFTAALVEALRVRPNGTELRVVLDERTSNRQYPGARMTWVEPVRSSPVQNLTRESGIYMRFDGLGKVMDLSKAGAIAATVRENIATELVRLNLPETLSDLSRETSKRGIEAFIAVQASAKEHWPEHEIEAMLAAIAKKTGKAKIDLRSVFEQAQARVRKAKAQVNAQTTVREEDTASEGLTVREEAYCRKRADGLGPRAAARAADYSHPEVVIEALEQEPKIKARIAELMAVSVSLSALEESGSIRQAAERARWDEDDANRAAAKPLSNATEEFFALNVGFYGMSVDQAAAQMSLPLGVGDSLIENDAVSKRIAYLRTCRPGGEA